MANFTETQHHAFDRAMLAVATAEQVPYSQGAIKAAYDGRPMYAVLPNVGTRKLLQLPDQRSGDDGRMIVTVSSAHPLLTSQHPKMLHPEVLEKIKFSTALKEKYGLNHATMLMVPGKPNGLDDEERTPSKMLLLITQDDMRQLARQALEILADRGKASVLLEFDRERESLPYETQIKDPESNLVEMVKRIYDNGGFVKGDKDIARIMTECCKEGVVNFDFAILLRGLDDPSKGPKSPMDRAQKSDNPAHRS